MLRFVLLSDACRLPVSGAARAVTERIRCVGGVVRPAPSTLADSVPLGDVGRKAVAGVDVFVFEVNMQLGQSLLLHSLHTGKWPRNHIASTAA